MLDPKLSILNRLGHFESNKKFSAVDYNGEPIPWITYPAFEFLSQLDWSALDIFEWGSGNSTLFYANRAAGVVSIDDKSKWTELVSGIANVQSVCCGPDSYAEQILNYGVFDVIVIDGIRRLSCSKLAYRHLKPGGMIVLDNSDWYVDALELLSDIRGLIRVDFSGFGPINNYAWTTSIFFSREFSVPRLSLTPEPTGGLCKNLEMDT